MADIFPKRIYITKDETEDSQYFLDRDLRTLAEEEEDETLVAVYELVKVGSVKKYSKVVFE